MPRKTPDEMRAEANAIRAQSGAGTNERRDALQWDTTAELAEYTEQLIAMNNTLLASFNILSRFMRERLAPGGTKATRKRT